MVKYITQKLENGKKTIKQSSHHSQRNDIRNKISHNTLEGKEDIIQVDRDSFQYY